MEKCLLLTLIIFLKIFNNTSCILRPQTKHNITIDLIKSDRMCIVNLCELWNCKRIRDYAQLLNHSPPVLIICHKKT